MSSRARLVLGVVALVVGLMYLVFARLTYSFPFKNPLEARREEMNRPAPPLPSNVQGTWYSCDVEDCSKVRITLGARTVVIAGSGGGRRCLSATTGIDGVEADGSMTTIEPSEFTVSGPMTLVRSGDALDIAGSSEYGGHYTKRNCVGGYRAPAAPVAEPEAEPTPAAAAAPEGDGDSHNRNPCYRGCMASQNACVMRCGLAPEGSCLSECGAKGQECFGACG